MLEFCVVVAVNTSAIEHMMLQSWTTYLFRDVWIRVWKHDQGNGEGSGGDSQPHPKALESTYLKTSRCELKLSKSWYSDKSDRSLLRCC